eukprot:gene672-1819_t
MPEIVVQVEDNALTVANWIHQGSGDSSGQYMEIVKKAKKAQAIVESGFKLKGAQPGKRKRSQSSVTVSTSHSGFTSASKASKSGVKLTVVVPTAPSNHGTSLGSMGGSR